MQEVFLVALIGSIFTVLVLFITHNIYVPNEWLLGVGLENPKNNSIELTMAEKNVLAKMIAQSKIISATTIFDNLVANYHMLISLLVTIIGLLSGLFALKFYKSKEEHDVITKMHLDGLFKDITREIKTNGFNKSLEKEPKLKQFLTEQLLKLVEDSEIDSYSQDVLEEYMRRLTDELSSILDNEFIDGLYEDFKSRLNEEKDR